MRIGVMLRALDAQGGISVYAHNITRELLRLDSDHQYVLLYRSPAHLGRFAHHPQVTERVVPAPNPVVWDQVMVPLACRTEKLDVLFHPKFTVPMLAQCPTVMVLHGAGWLMPEFQSFWSALDRRYVRAAMPLYCRRAAAIISVSRLTTETFNRVFGLPPGKISTIYFAPARSFRRVSDPQVLARVRDRYRLPEQFILTLSGYNRGSRKNASGILQAYQAHHGKTPHRLVIAGKGCDRFRADYGIPDTGYGADILFPGWIEQDDLPAVYSLADVFLYPSNVEAFPIPITEALACGTPIITSRGNGLGEIAGEAAVFVDAADPAAIAEALDRVLSDRQWRARLSDAGLRRAEEFRWDECAQATLRVLTGAAAGTWT